MGVREDFICDDFKTVPVPYLNRRFTYEEINCDGYDLNGYLKIPGLAKSSWSGNYECSRWSEESDYDDFGEGIWVDSTCLIKPEMFSHCSQFNMCVSNRNTKVQV